jgi:hypothetical protein
VPHGSLTHETLDNRSLAFDKVIVDRLRSNPLLIQDAQSILQRRLTTCGPRVLPALLEWREILNGAFDKLIEVMTSSDERAIRLRQSSPFCGEGFITREERATIIRSFRYEAQ